ncbi:Uu.00g012540.m01.CDS01 [Anthostomella pinea]|uniref:Uu.00g012540.m01.CDS01 n=1 Tax=Anthostomella pinea TaxID=933095 RepID=A0AAI8VYK5_9PEZI|nr:Uu.00g012540.m01.CDS01 [Anthostomella pinea]
MEKLATETLVAIFGFTDLEGVHSLLLTCKKTYNAFKGSAHHISKAQIFQQLANPRDYKLSVMVIESRQVDPLERAGVEKFIEDFMHHQEYDLGLFRMQTAYNLPRLNEALDYVIAVDNADAYHERHAIVPETPTELARRRRNFLMQEVCLNLFHRLPGKYGALLCEPPYQGLFDAYWQNFSRGKISEVAGHQFAYPPILFDAWSKISGLNCPQGRKGVSGDTCHCFEKWQLEGYGYESTEPPRPVLFSHLVGVEQLYSWSCGSKTRCIHREWMKFVDQTPLSEADLVNLQVGGPGWRPLTNKEWSSVRFQEDPKAMSEKTWDWGDKDWEAYLEDGGRSLDQRCSAQRTQWDEATALEWRRKAQNGEI